MAFPNSGLFLTTWMNGVTGNLALNLASPSLKIALYTNNLSGADLTTDGVYGSGAWASNEVPAADGYETGGQVIPNPTVTDLGSGIIRWSADDVVWPAPTTITARGGLIYDAGESDVAIAAVNFGRDISSNGGLFRVQFHARILDIHLRAT